MSPTTLAYLEEAKESGLPVIPFAYPTCVLVDRMKHKDSNPEPQVPTRQKSAPTNHKKSNTTGKVKVNSKTSRQKSTESNSKKSFDYEDQSFKSPPGTLESIVDIAQREYREETLDGDLELEEDFFCGSVGSVSTISENMNNNNNRISRIVQANWNAAEVLDTNPDILDHMMMGQDQKWHDYLNMSKQYPTVGRSKPISIKEKQY